MGKIIIGLIDSDTAFRNAFAEHFRKNAAFDCVIAAESVEKFQKYYRPQSPLRILLLELDISGVSGIESIQTLRKTLPTEAEIIMYTQADEASFILKAFCLGANGYVLKTAQFANLEKHLQTCVELDAPALSPKVARRIVEYFNPKTTSQVGGELSPVEFQVVQFLSEGKSYQEIADMLSISINGVKYHQKRIYKKTQVASRGELAKRFFENRL